MIWALFISLILVFLILDLGVFHKDDHDISFQEALTWSIIWIFTALLFNGLIFYLYSNNPLGLIHGESILSGADAAIKFFTAYLVEKSLSLDNIFVIALIFTYFKIPLRYQHRLLFWGILSAIVFRGLFIWLGILIIQQFKWSLILFGVLLIITAIKMLIDRHDNIDADKNLIIKTVKRFIETTSDMGDGKFFIKQGAKWVATPLFIALLMVETADLAFAIDSIPAIYSVTTDPFIIFSSNIFAILGLRSLYFVLAASINKLRHLKISLIYLLIFIGTKMIISPFFHFPVWVTLTMIVGILSSGILASLGLKEDSAKLLSPIQNDLKKITTISYKHLRKTVVGIFGVTVLLVGIAMLVLPGPGLLVIPIGLSILSLEFIWAQKLLLKYKEGVKTNVDKIKALIKR